MAYYHFDLSALGKTRKINGAINSAYSILRKQMRDKNKLGSENLKELENFLNSVFYPTTDTSFSNDYKDAQELLLKDYNNTLQSIVNNFDIESFSSRVNEGIEKDERNYFRRRTLSGAIAQAESNLKNLQEMSPIGNSQQYRDMQKQIQEVINRAQEALSGLSANIKVNKEDAVYKNLTFLKTFNSLLSSAKNISNQKAGANFEEALVEAVTQITNEGTNELIQYITGAERTGDKTIQRGIDNIDKGAITVNYSIDKDTKKQLPKGFVSEEKNMSIKYNPGSKKMGKMDVLFHVNDDGVSDIRISAKRWSRGFGDFGETSIDAGISRAGGVSVAEAYKLAVLINTMGKETKAHDYAKLALASDIVLGLNQGVQQEGGYANVLIVDDGNHIHVKSLFEIASSAQTKIRGYNDTEIQGVANNAYKQIENLRDGRTSAYFYKMTSTLNKMKVTIDYSVK